MSPKQKARFRITAWDEKAISEFEDGAKISVAHVTQEYDGGITGTGTVEYVMCYTDAESASFSGFELIKGAVDGVDGSFMIRHDGIYENGIARSKWEVVPGSGRDGLGALSGTGAFTAGHGGEADVEFDLSGT